MIYNLSYRSYVIPFKALLVGPLHCNKYVDLSNKNRLEVKVDNQWMLQRESQLEMR